MDTKIGGLTIHDYDQQVSPDETKARADLVARYGKVWDTRELQLEFEVLGFSAPFIIARRRADGVRGILEFTHSPRFYFGFEPSVR